VGNLQNAGSTQVSHATGPLIWALPLMVLSVDDAIIPYVCNVYTWGVLPSAMKYKMQ
jgi:hypothetical protein